MRIDKKRLRQQGNRSAHSYDEYAIVQKKIAHRLLHDLQSLAFQPQYILELGCGTGYLTQLLVDHFPEAQVTAIDLSEQMIHVAQANMEFHPRVQWKVGDAEQVDDLLQGSFDLIVSNAMIHWLETPEETIAKWLQWLRPDGWFFATTYGPEHFQELHTLFQEVEMDYGIRPEQHAPPFYTSEKWVQLVGGLKDVSATESWDRLSYANCRTFLHSIQRTGESYSQSRSIKRTLLTEVIKRYDRAYRTREGVYATHHWVHLHGQKRS